ncbi:hypothetical protein HUU05_08290 [candidate division KSB1 bacterium]|nr:hypothetical protein [candidate division KSB1 bacterium]
MKKVMIVVALLGLALIVIPAMLVFMNRLSWQTHAHLMLLGTILWFVAAPWWMREVEK